MVEGVELAAALPADEDLLRGVGPRGGASPLCKEEEAAEEEV